MLALRVWSGCLGPPSRPRGGRCESEARARYPAPLGAVIDVGLVPCFLKSQVGTPLPCLAPAFQKLFLVPVPVFLSKAIRANAAHGQQDMGVWVVALGVVNHHVGHHATLYEVGTGKVPH